MSELFKLARKTVLQLIPGRHHVKETQDRSRLVVDYFVHDSYNCSEAVIQSFEHENEKFHLDLLGAASPFGGGIGGSGKTCGALTGGLLLMGAQAKARGLDKKKIRALGSEFVTRFQEEFKAEDCATLSRHDCDDPAQGDFDLNHCGPYLSFCVRHVERVLIEIDSSSSEKKSNAS